MAQQTVKTNFWGSWSQLPFPNNHQDITASWLQHPDEQLSIGHLAKKNLQRLLYLYFSGQRQYWRNSIPKNTKKILWLYITENIGDAIMRLAPIQLLQDKFDVDLYSTKAAIQLFQPGRYFENIYQLDKDAAKVAENDYDLVIIDGIQTKPLKQKIAAAKQTPFVTLHELFHFARNDYNSSYFCWWRMQYLLRLFANEANSEPNLVIDIPQAAKQKVANLAIPNDAIALVLGGREEYKTYQYWLPVLHGLLKQNPNYHFVLLGSDNGLTAAEQIMAAIDVDKLTNCVGQYSLMESAAIIDRCAQLFCVDGGLMHVGRALDKKITTLFGRHNPEDFFTREDDYRALAIPGNVSDIAPEAVIKLFT